MRNFIQRLGQIWVIKQSPCIKVITSNKCVLFFYQEYPNSGQCDLHPYPPSGHLVPPDPKDTP